ncbi:AI-2E family transporter [Salipiger aestuarii]|uniref:AI-2E family transporter n=1 Tax=Salipiger aestuarii TaxID=568098 RepID=UPI00123985A6|nr:AI-2E family transporter [Salipiger aestuarii]
MTPATETDPPPEAMSRLDGIQDQLRKSAPRWAVNGLFILAFIFTLSYARTFLVPVVLGLLLALVFGPIRRFFDRRGVPEGLTALAIVLSLLFGLIALTGALAMPVAGWIERAPQITADVRTQLSELSAPLSGIFEAEARLNELTGSDAPGVQKVELQGSSYAASIAAAAPGIVTQLVFTLVLLFFLLASGDMFYEKIVHVMPTFKDKRRAIQAAHDIERRLSRYLLTISVINAGLGVIVGAAMWAFGMPSPAIFGLIAFIFNFVPFLGAIVGVVIAAAVALVTFDWLWWAPIVGLTYFACTSLEGQFVTPHIVGRSLRLNTVVVFLAVSFWAWLWSAVGMIVAVPLLVAIRTICEYVDGLDGFGDFLGERGSEAEPETGKSRAED